MTLVAIAILGRDDSISLPPVRDMELADAAARAGCDLRHFDRGADVSPPVDGPRWASAALPGAYDRPPPADALGAAVREGIIVIHHRAGLPREQRTMLETLQRAVPHETILTPLPVEGRYEIAVTAYRRLLTCPRLDDETIEALRLFRGRYLGSGPDG